jgi:hypothetical protein
VPVIVVVVVPVIVVVVVITVLAVPLALPQPWYVVSASKGRGGGAQPDTISQQCCRSRVSQVSVFRWSRCETGWSNLWTIWTKHSGGERLATDLVSRWVAGLPLEGQDLATSRTLPPSKGKT